MCVCARAFLSRATGSGLTRRETPSSILSLDDDRTLSEDLKVPRGMTFDPIPAQLFRKCVYMLRETVHVHVHVHSSGIVISLCS